MAEVRITGTGSYLPDRVLTNFDLEKIVDTSDAWIRKRTGIGERRLARAGESASDLGREAAVEALAQAELAPEDLELLILATITPDTCCPSGAMGQGPQSWTPEAAGAPRFFPLSFIRTALKGKTFSCPGEAQEPLPSAMKALIKDSTIYG